MSDPDPFVTTFAKPERGVEGDAPTEQLAQGVAEGAIGDALRAPEIQQARASAKQALFGTVVDPVRIDRFLVVKRLGSGGMGVVYSAYDPQLDRKVALKLLHSGSDADDPLAARLVREAQAMAKVRHPNVITVHEVGRFEDQVFVAMEFVEGQTLTRWTRQGDRTWAEIRNAFLAVGRGLAAAHAAGLVHRDFKPDNVMIGDDGRILVLDFGLAKRLEEASSTSGEQPPVTQPPTTEASVTQTGAVMGTPAYMAPEQFDSPTVDARADQFSFCVALFEAIYSRRPFSGKTFIELAQAVKAGLVDPPGERGDMPAAAYRAMLRGLRPQPDDRFPAMEPLLVELGHDPSVRRRQVLMIGTVTLALASGAVATTELLATEDPACDDAMARIDRAWSDDAKSRGKSAFAAVDRPYAGEAWDSAEAVLDEYASRYRTTHAAVCDGDGDPEARLPQVLCLRWRSQEIGALARLFAEADAQVVERAVEAANALTPPSVCDSELALQAGTRLPDDETLRARVVELRAELAHAKGLGDAGKYDPAIEAVTGVLASPAAGRYAPLEAESSLRLGVLQRAAGRHEAAQKSLESAAYVGLRGERDDLALEAAIELVWLLGSERADFERALPWIDLGRALSQRTSTGGAHGRLELAVGATFSAAGRHAEGLEYLVGAVEAARHEGGNARELIDALVLYADVSATMGSYDDAIGRLAEARSLAASAYGDSHPTVAEVHVRLGELHTRLGRVDAAREHLDQALAIEEQARGTSHPAVATSLAGLARIDWATGQTTEAIDRVHRIEEVSKHGRVDDPVLVDALVVLGTIYLELGREREARSVLNRALAVAKRRGPDHPLQTFALAGLSEVHRRAGDLERAGTLLDSSRELGNRRLGVADPRRIELSISIGELLLDRGEAKSAVDVLRRAIDRFDQCCPEHFRRGEAEFALARAMVAAGDEADARRTAQEASARLAAAGRTAVAETVANWRPEAPSEADSDGAQGTQDLVPAPE